MLLPSLFPASLRARRCILQGFQVFERDRTGLQKVRDQHPRRPPEQLEQIPNQSAAELALVDGGLEQLSIANFLHFAQSPFLLEPVDEGLNSCVSDALILRQTVENLADGTSSQFPVLLQDSGFGFGQTRFVHVSYVPRQCYYKI